MKAYLPCLNMIVNHAYLSGNGFLCYHSFGILCYFLGMDWTGIDVRIEGFVASWLGFVASPH